MFGHTIRVNVDEEDVIEYSLPVILRFEDGTKVKTPADWLRRREEILSLFRKNVYGLSPWPSGEIAAAEFESGSLVLDGLARRTQLRVHLLADPNGPFLDLLVYAPANRRRAPVFLGLNFKGNHTVHADRAIRLPTTPIPGGAVGDPNPLAASDSERGSLANRWPVEAILQRGYALVTAYCGDIAYDGARLAFNGLLGTVAEAEEARADDAPGAIAAWAFGLSRALDWIETQDTFDPSRVAVIGHSRLGKAALWAGAQDTRFGLVISNNSGCGGAALSRRRFGESVDTINKFFPHWFARRFRNYSDREADLPVDQHQLLAAVAPRLLYVASAEDDAWADPVGERLATEAAGEVSGWLRSPAPGYHRRPGEHEITPSDWQCFLDHADRHWNGKKALDARLSIGTDPLRSLSQGAQFDEPAFGTATDE